MQGPNPMKKAEAVARSFVDVQDRAYAMAYLCWVVMAPQYRGKPKPAYQGIGSAARIEAAIDAALEGEGK